MHVFKTLRAKRYIHCTFLECPTAGENAKAQKAIIPVPVNLKTLILDGISANINQFKKALVQVQEQVKADWKVYKKYMGHNKAYKDF